MLVWHDYLMHWIPIWNLTWQGHARDSVVFIQNQILVSAGPPFSGYWSGEEVRRVEENETPSSSLLLARVSAIGMASVEGRTPHLVAASGQCLHDQDGLRWGADATTALSPRPARVSAIGTASGKMRSTLVAASGENFVCLHPERALATSSRVVGGMNGGRCSITLSNNGWTPSELQEQAVVIFIHRMRNAAKWNKLFDKPTCSKTIQWIPDLNFRTKLKLPKLIFCSLKSYVPFNYPMNPQYRCKRGQLLYVFLKF